MIGHASRRRGNLFVACALSVAMLLVAGCNPSAAERLAKAADVIGPRIGKTADEVVQGFKFKLALLTDEQIAVQAERTVQETSWIDAMLARAAQNRIKIAKVAHSAACDWIEVADAWAQETPDAQAKAFAEIVVGHIRSEGISPSDAELRDLVNTILDQVDRMQTGTLDPGKLSTDLACLF